MYDALAEAVPLADTGHNRKKAVVVISDGNDTNSRTSVPELKQLIRESEVMVYAVGIDGDGSLHDQRPVQPAPCAGPISVADARRPTAAVARAAAERTVRRRWCAGRPRTIT
mgnify:CR=1 FL=1